jgi:hypothetical protein
LAFGIHSCIGAAMSRMEGEVAIGAFFDRFESVELIDVEPRVQAASLPLTRALNTSGGRLGLTTERNDGKGKVTGPGQVTGTVGHTDPNANWMGSFNPIATMTLPHAD